MEHKAKRIEPAREVEYVAKTMCDFCGEEIKDDSYSHDKDEITIQRQKGEHYPSGSSGTYYEVDMCSTCWEHKFLKWLNEQRVSLRERDYDW